MTLDTLPIAIAIARRIIDLECPLCRKKFAPEEFSMYDLLFKHILKKPQCIKFTDDLSPVYVKSLRILTYLVDIESNHVPRNKVDIKRDKRMYMYDRKCLALYKLSKEFQLTDDLLKELFECCTSRIHLEMWRLREYLYHGFLLTYEIKEPPQWVVDVAKAEENANS